MHLLIAEDDTRLAKLLDTGLRGEGHVVDIAHDGDEALLLALETAFDVLVLDVMMPGLDGFTVVRRLRDRGVTTPALFLTARGEVADRVEGLDAGGDDYLVKPFAFAELLARVRALVRRRYATTNPVIEIGDLAVDTAKRAVTRAGTAIVLSAREYALLEYLAVRKGEVVTRTEIWEHVYDFRSEAQSNVVDVYIGYVRKKLGPPPLIHTRRGLGYVLGEDSE